MFKKDIYRYLTGECMFKKDRYFTGKVMFYIDIQDVANMCIFMVYTGSTMRHYRTFFIKTWDF